MAENWPLMEFLFWSIFMSLITSLAFFARVYWVLVRRKSHKAEKSNKLVKTMIVVGSGGHTTEMLTMLSYLSNSYDPRVYVMAESDISSEEKIHTLELNKKYEIHKIPRSREVHQSWITTVITTLKSFLFSFPIVFKTKPNLILCNGPGTCIPICVAAFILKVFGVQSPSVVYVESFCRVETLSLSGKILYYFADQIIVQWKQLEAKYPRTKFIGRLM